MKIFILLIFVSVLVALVVKANPSDEEMLSNPNSAKG
jgi:hypothetical protein